MVLKTIPRRSLFAVFSLALLAAGLAGAVLRADDKPRPGEVSLPLKEYLTLVEAGERAAKEKIRQAAQREAPVAEVVAQHVALVVGGAVRDDVEVSSELDVLVQGAPVKPVFLPFSGYPAKTEVKLMSGSSTGAPAAVTAVNGGGGVVLVAPDGGKYTVKVSGRAHLDDDGGIQRLAFAPVVAPVAATDVDLPADLAWSCPGAVVVEDQVQGNRRHVRLAARRGEKQVLELRRKIDSAEADKLIAQTVVLTLFQLRPEGPRRHDVILYELSRGSLGRFTVALPPGLEVEQAGTDEGAVVPVVENGSLTIHRQHQLQGTGYLVLTSTPAAEALAQGVPLAAVKPEYDVRARYLALSSAVAADARPLPEKAWSRVDLSDLPPSLSEALAALDLTAAWRLSGTPAEAEGARLAVTALPAAPSLDATVTLRETTTLMTVDGTLLHRDRFTLESRSRAGASLDLTLPAGAKLWSAKVDDQPVRPLEHGGVVSVPLGFDSGARAVVEIVAVLDRAIPPGRSQLALDLPQVRIPVLDHRWKVLLPEGPRYRFNHGDLRPASVIGAPTARDPWQILQKTPGVLTDRINVGGNAAGQQSGYIAPMAVLRGKVVDEQGSALPGVTLTLSGSSLPPVVQVSNAQGVFQMNGIPGGTYRFKAELEGFSTVEYPSVNLASGQTASLEVTLSAAVEDVITVTAETPVLDQRRISTGETIPLNEPKPSYDFSAGRKDKKRDEDQEALRSKALFAQEAQGLQQGLVGGVKPLPISIPESGKVLLLTGVLPPSRVAVELEVKAKSKGLW
ncbi:MAG TPA: carboxypeptidase-like regulatory domain-containing protein [Thermoanaerobaculia bacterium]|jgi:hypothetical protein|nr:carboxypeptidase-like regulatory domain-containing protein [Thermoanaerobaculia bacterium]